MPASSYVHGANSVPLLGETIGQSLRRPVERFGEEVTACIKPSEGARLTAEQMTEHCRGKIATYKIPRYWKSVEEFPVTVTGKVQKFRMREMAVEELGLQQAAETKTA